MGELYPDYFERLLIPELKNELEGDRTRYQETEDVKDFWRRQSIPISHRRATADYDDDDHRMSLLSGAR
jgi:hypothetical protein